MGEYCQGWSMWSGAHSPLLHSHGQDVKYKTNWKIVQHLLSSTLNNPQDRLDNPASASL